MLIVFFVAAMMYLCFFLGVAMTVVHVVYPGYDGWVPLAALVVMLFGVDTRLIPSSCLRHPSCLRPSS